MASLPLKNGYFFYINLSLPEVASSFFASRDPQHSSRRLLARFPSNLADFLQRFADFAETSIPPRPPRGKDDLQL